MRWASHAARMGESRGVYRVFCGEKLRDRNHLEDPGIDVTIIHKMELQEVGCRVMDWFELAQDRDR